MNDGEGRHGESTFDRPNVSRMYDYLLGGHHNFAVDRAAVDAASGHFPDLPLIIRANRAFLRRAVTYVTEQGIDQFLDLGSGLPTVGNVHNVAHDLNPAARVVYMDNDPVTVMHARTVLKGNLQVAVIQGDLRDAEGVLARPEVNQLLDLSQPLAVLLVSVLHFVSDAIDVQRIVQSLRDAIPPGSYLVISHASREGARQETRSRAEAEYTRDSTPMTRRTQEEITALFEGFEVVDPGVVYVPLWRPEEPDDLLLDEPERCSGFAGVGRKP